MYLRTTHPHRVRDDDGTPSLATRQFEGMSIRKAAPKPAATLHAAAIPTQAELTALDAQRAATRAEKKGLKAELEKLAVPATLHDGMVRLARENPKLKGFKLRVAALKRWPQLRAACMGIPADEG